MSADPNMIKAYQEGKDLYATIAMGVYHNDYWDNMEHHEDGSANPEGKKRRGNCKKLLLGITYGMGAKSIADSIGGTLEEAQEIIDNFYRSFPKVKTWMDESVKNAQKTGYVEDFWGRRRRLPDIQLPPFHVEYKDKNNANMEFNPLLDTLGLVGSGKEDLLSKYFNLAKKTKNRKELESLEQQALKDGVILHSNSGKIAQAERQCVNARIQGSAASMSKKAMVKVHHDSELKNLGFKMLIAVHDELIGECPAENAELVADRLTTIMKHSAEPEVVVPFKCDPTIEPCWYYSDYSDTLQEEFKKRRDKGESAKDIFDDMCEKYSECTKEQLSNILRELIQIEIT